MRYRTVIEVVSEAGNEHDAADSAGEYLVGRSDNILSMKCHTEPVRSSYSFKYLAMTTSLAVLGLLIFMSSRAIREDSCSGMLSIGSRSAIQPPLRTASSSGNFAELWEKRNLKAFFSDNAAGR